MPWLIGLLAFALLCLGVPIYLIFLTSAMVALWYSGLPTTVVPRNMFGSIDSFTLLAVPFFIASAEVSVAKLFLGGFLPGVLIGLFMTGYTIWYARRHPLQMTPRFNWSAFARTSLDALGALGVPVVLGGIYSSIFTPTEAAGIAGVYAILVSALVYRDMGWRGIWDVAVRSGIVTAQLMIIVAGSAVFTWYLTVSGVPGLKEWLDLLRTKAKQYAE
jgi:TRAP-type C4-dicarboxylate transport system permease large subunit